MRSTWVLSVPWSAIMNDIYDWLAKEQQFLSLQCLQINFVQVQARSSHWPQQIVLATGAILCKDNTPGGPGCSQSIRPPPPGGWQLREGPTLGMLSEDLVPHNNLADYYSALVIPAGYHKQTQQRDKYQNETKASMRVVISFLRMPCNSRRHYYYNNMPSPNTNFFGWVISSDQCCVVIWIFKEHGVLFF
jgi:hypothetical protein